MKKLLSLLLVISLLAGCKKENAFDCFKSNGEDITQYRSIGSFSAVMISDNFEVTFFNDSVCRVEVICGKHIISNIKTEVVRDTLVLDNRNRCNFVRGYKRKIQIRVFVPYVNYVENESVGNVTFDNGYAQDSISLRLSSSGDISVNGTFRCIKTSSNGNGDVYANGKTKRFYVYTAGINYVYAENLDVSDYVFVHTKSKGDCRVKAEGTREFDYNIEDSGNIYYIGDPLAMTNWSSGKGSGKIIKE